MPLPTIPSGNVASALGGGYEVANSCRFNDGSSDNLTKSFSSPTTANKFTLSFWIKRSSLQLGSNTQSILNTDSGNLEEMIRFEENDRLHIFTQNSAGAQTSSVKPSYMFRDVSAWYHICIAIDTTQGTDTNRYKFFVNGTRLTDFETTSYISQNYTLRLNTAVTHEFGVRKSGAYLDGYIAELVYIDGQQLDADQFGEFDEDTPTVWKPIDVSGLTFGNNGFYLDFEDSSALGNDVSGNNNDFSANNLTALDQATDTCTNNFATFNALNIPSSTTLSEGNLKGVTGGSQRDTLFSTIGVANGRWYAEFKLEAGEGNNVRMDVGINGDPAEIVRTVVPIGDGSTGFAFDGESAVKVTNGSNSGSFGSALSIGDIVMIAVDLDNLKIYFGKNGSWFESGDPTSGSTGTGSAFNLTAPSSTPSGFYFIGVADHSAGFHQTFNGNFGGCSAFSISSGNADANGYGNFEYAVPNSYYSLCTKNLAEFG